MEITDEVFEAIWRGTDYFTKSEEIPIGKSELRSIKAPPIYPMRVFSTLDKERYDPITT